MLTSFNPRKKGPGRRNWRNKTETNLLLEKILKGEIVAAPGAKLAKKALQQKLTKKF